MFILLPQMKILLVIVKISYQIKLHFSRRALFHVKSRDSLKYFVNDAPFSLISVLALLSCSFNFSLMFFDL